MQTSCLVRLNIALWTFFHGYEQVNMIHRYRVYYRGLLVLLPCPRNVEITELAALTRSMIAVHTRSTVAVRTSTGTLVV